MYELYIYNIYIYISWHFGMDLDNKYWSDDIQKSGRLQNLVVIHSQ